MEYQLWGSVELLLPTLRYHFLAGFVNSSSAVFMSCERFYALYRPLKHRTNFVNKGIRHCYNKCNLDTGYSCQRDVLCSCKLNFIHSSLLSFYNSIFLLIICFRNISIWTKCLKKEISSHQQNRGTAKIWTRIYGHQIAIRSCNYILY